MAGEMEELKPCPLCGAQFELNKTASNRSAQLFNHPPREPRCVLEGINLWTDDPEATAAWNRRASPDESELKPVACDRMRWFLTILSNCGGTADASDTEYNWINTFCEEVEGRNPDTFNAAADAGFTHVTHDSSFDSSTVHLTDAGRAFLAAPAPRPGLMADEIADARHQCAASGMHEHEGCSCTEAELAARRPADEIEALIAELTGEFDALKKNGTNGGTLFADDWLSVTDVVRRAASALSRQADRLRELEEISTRQSADLDRAEADRVEAEAERDRLAEKVFAATKNATMQRERAEAAESTISSLSGEVERLRAQLDAVEEPIIINIKTMKLSGDRKEHYTCIRRGDREITPNKYSDAYRNRAEYEIAEWKHILLGYPKPDLMDPKYNDPPSTQKGDHPDAAE